MAIIGIVRTEWSGTSGGPGLTQIGVLGAAGGDWNPSGAQTAVNAVRSFWDAIKALLPDELVLSVSPVVDTYDRATGELVGSTTAASAPASVVGTSAAVYAGGAGFKIVWNTGQIRNGRRVRGATYVVPASSTVYGNNGTILSASRTTVNTAAAAMLSALNAGGTPMGIFSRPVIGDNARAGFATEVISGTCSPKTAILRGRRD